MATLSFIFLLALSLLLNLSCLPFLAYADGGDDNYQPSGNLTCDDGKSYSQYRCSPTVSSSTEAILTANSFIKGGDGGDPPECDESFHDNTESVVALSTGWFDNKSRCNKTITITAISNGRSTTAKVVDQCDSVNGCDREHDYQPPCRNNIVDASKAVWENLGLQPGEASVTWSMADE